MMTTLTSSEYMRLERSAGNAIMSPEDEACLNLVRRYKPERRTIPPPSPARRIAVFGVSIPPALDIEGFPQHQQI